MSEARTRKGKRKPGSVSPGAKALVLFLQR